MNRFELIEAAIAEKRSADRPVMGNEGSTGDRWTDEKIRAALQDATEGEREALVQPLTALLTRWRSKARKDSQFVSECGGVEVALVACEPDSPGLRRRLTSHCPNKRLMRMLDDRRPSWMAEVMRDLFATTLPADLLEDRNWQTAEQLRRILGAPRPLDERNATALGIEICRRIPSEPVVPGDRFGLQRMVGNPATVLRGDPDAEAIAFAVLRSPHLGRISAHFWSTKDEKRENGWPRAIAELTEESVIDRGRAIDACLDALGEDASRLTLAERLLVLEMLAPTAEEIEHRRAQLENLASSPHKFIGKHALELHKKRES